MARTRQQLLGTLSEQVRQKLHNQQHLREDDDVALWLLSGAPEAAQALRRIDEGSYGQCADCNGQIPLARLRVKPEATRCVNCQARHERAAPAAGLSVRFAQM